MCIWVGNAFVSLNIYIYSGTVNLLTQISFDSGFKKLNTPGFCLTGFFIMIEMPSDMNGLLKSITRSRSDVIVIGAIAMSASCKHSNKNS